MENQSEAFENWVAELLAEAEAKNSFPMYMVESLIDGVPSPKVGKKQKPVRPLLDYKINPTCQSRFHHSRLRRRAPQEKSAKARF